jgi:hypothetical protein
MTFYDRVPKTLKENLEYRRKILTWAQKSKQNRADLLDICRSDILYFINTFLYLYEPRPSDLVGTKSHFIPFITYGYQDKAFLQMDEALGYRDVGIEKSRDLGATWMFLTLFFYHWLFRPGASLGLMSRKEDLVDKRGNKDTLFWKLDFLLEGEGGKFGLPSWMRPKYTRTAMLLVNDEHGGTIEGAATTNNAFRGGRKTAIGLGKDYEAQKAVQHATSSRFYVSTPSGASGSYYELMHEPSSMLKIVLDWKDHPTRGKGLYTSTKDGKLQRIDKEYVFDKDYKFIRDGKVRSPYYDFECSRPGATPQSIAQELDRDYGGSEYQLFGQDLYEVGLKACKPPIYRGVLGYDMETLAPLFNKTEDGPLELWCQRNVRDEPIPRDYVIGCDISAGLGGSKSSNSVAHVLDAHTKEQVAEYVTSTMRPDDFADLCISLSKWFHGAFLGWEENGPTGSAFTKRILERGYKNIYFRNVEQVNFKKKTKRPGWNSNTRTKAAVLTALAMAIKSKTYSPRSRMLLEECRQYIYKDGKIVHSRSAKTQDDSAKGESHGDRVIAAAVALEVSKDRAARKPDDIKRKAPYGSMAYRMEQYEAEQRLKEADPWTTTRKTG